MTATQTILHQFGSLFYFIQFEQFCRNTHYLYSHNSHIQPYKAQDIISNNLEINWPVYYKKKSKKKIRITASNIWINSMYNNIDINLILTVNKRMPKRLRHQKKNITYLSLLNQNYFRKKLFRGKPQFHFHLCQQHGTY